VLQIGSAKEGEGGKGATTLPLLSTGGVPVAVPRLLLRRLGAGNVRVVQVSIGSATIAAAD
jgi:hypothetical protein